MADESVAGASQKTHDKRKTTPKNPPIAQDATDVSAAGAQFFAQKADLLDVVSSDGASILDRWRNSAGHQFRDLKRAPKLTAGDAVAGISVAMVVIPQSLAYADLAGLPPLLGLFASAFPLLIFAVFASSPYLQTGPVALTSLLTAGALAGAGLEPRTEDYVAAAALLAIVVGAIRLIVGLGRLGSIVYLMAEPVTIGFTSGAGIVILGSQLPKALGVSLPENVSAWSNPIARAGWAVLNPTSWGVSAIVISIVTLTLMLKGKKLHRLFPGVLVAVVITLFYSRVFGYDGQVIPEVEAGLPPFSLDFPWSGVGSLIVGGVIIALVGFAEPASIARHFANEDQSKWSSSREFVASGLANTVAAVTGAYPVGGSFSRSSVNRFAGAETRLSGAVTGLVVIAFLPFAFLLDGLPEAVLGAIVVGAVVNLVKPRRLIGLWKRDRWQAGLAYATFLATLVTPPDIHYAVLGGVVLTMILHVLRPFSIKANQTAEGGLELQANGLLWIATVSKLQDQLAAAIENDSGSGPISLSLGRSPAIDSSIAQAIAAGSEAAERAGRSFFVLDPPDGGAPILENFDIPLGEPQPA